jgi:hypothetical protein
MEKDYIYLIHKVGYENLELGVSFSETLEYLESNGVKIVNEQKLESIQRTYSQVFIDSKRDSIGFNPKDKTKFYMLTDSYYRHLEYLELVDARKNAEDAKRQSMIAIGLTLLALVASIIIGILELRQSG